MAHPRDWLSVDIFVCNDTTSPYNFLKRELEDRLAAADKRDSVSWPEIIADLELLTETKVQTDGRRFLLRSPPRSAASHPLAALGVAPPPKVR